MRDIRVWEYYYYNSMALPSQRFQEIKLSGDVGDFLCCTANEFTQIGVTGFGEFIDTLPKDANGELLPETYFEIGRYLLEIEYALLSIKSVHSFDALLSYCFVYDKKYGGNTYDMILKYWTKLLVVLTSIVCNRLAVDDIAMLESDLAGIIDELHGANITAEVSSSSSENDTFATTDSDDCTSNISATNSTSSATMVAGVSSLTDVQSAVTPMEVSITPETVGKVGVCIDTVSVDDTFERTIDGARVGGNMLEDSVTDTLPVSTVIENVEDNIDIDSYYDDLGKDGILFEQRCGLPLEGFGDYTVSSFGYVYNPKGERLTGSITPYGGVSVALVRKEMGVRVVKNVMVHKLVAMVFLPQPSGTNAIEHIDGDRRNNRVDNLRWIKSRRGTLNRKNKCTHYEPDLSRYIVYDFSTTKQDFMIHNGDDETGIRLVNLVTGEELKFESTQCAARYICRLFGSGIQGVLASIKRAITMGKTYRCFEIHKWDYASEVDE